VKEALRQAHDDFDSIQVWSSAFESAEKSTFPRPGEVYDALKVTAVGTSRLRARLRKERLNTLA
jgi:hypothetical protein